MWILKNKEHININHSNLNVLYKKDKFFVMDNHLAAAWCWQQIIDVNQKYNFFQIDRHYDLRNNLSERWILLNRDKLMSSDVNDYLGVKIGKYPLVTHDNYLQIFLKLNPNLFDEFFFAAHDVEDYDKNIESYKPKIWELQNNLGYWINKNKNNQWVINLDLDFFFTEGKKGFFQFITDDYIIAVCNEIRDVYSRISIITIALSPSFCGGLDPSLRVMRIFSDFFNLNFRI